MEMKSWTVDTTPSPYLLGMWKWKKMMEENELLHKLSFKVLQIDVGSGTT